MCVCVFCAWGGGGACTFMCMPACVCMCVHAYVCMCTVHVCITIEEVCMNSFLIGSKVH